MLSRIKRFFIEYKELRYLAYHDSLTGLLNRTWLYKNINQLNYEYVYFIDINDLRKMNERGHTFGDEHIKTIVSGINHNGVLVRYAGDEFILFSNHKNEITTNHLYSVGFSKIINNHVSNAIHLADIDMIRNKLIYKK